MTTTNVSYMPASQAAQYVNCALLGTPIRLDGKDYYPWSDVEALRQKPASIVDTSSARKRRTAPASTGTRRTRSARPSQPASTGTSAGTRLTSAGRQSTPAPAPAPRKPDVSEATKTAATTSEELSAPITSRLRAKLRESAAPAPRRTSGRKGGTSSGAGSRVNRIDPAREAEDLAKRSRAELVHAAKAFGIVPGRLHSKTLARLIVEAKGNLPDRDLSEVSTRDELAFRRKGRPTSSRQKTAGRVVAVKFSHTGS